MSEHSATSRFLRVEESVDVACEQAARARSEVTVVAVSKKKSAAEIQLFIDHCNEKGVEPVLGENYLQEFVEKKDELHGEFKTHFIGRLQSNKVKSIMDTFDCIETVDSEKKLRLINKTAEALGVEYPCFLQVNISSDPEKAGFLPSAVREAVAGSRELASIRLLGLMAITKFYQQPEEATADFESLASLLEEVRSSADLSSLLGSRLSMGMSRDFAYAIACGATHVRIGSALFGPRAA